MKLNDIRLPHGAHKRRKRLGRGSGSGHGKTSTRGNKGIKARTGLAGKIRHGFEGGQMPLVRRMPKRGFNSQRKVVPQIVNISELNRFEDGARVDPALLKKEGLAKGKERPVKILGEGELKKNLTVAAHAFSQSAKDKIAKAGGRTEIIN